MVSYDPKIYRRPSFTFSQDPRIYCPSFTFLHDPRIKVTSFTWIMLFFAGFLDSTSLVSWWLLSLSTGSQQSSIHLLTEPTPGEQGGRGFLTGGWVGWCSRKGSLTSIIRIPLQPFTFCVHWTPSNQHSILGGPCVGNYHKSWSLWWGQLKIKTILKLEILWTFWWRI